MKIFIIGSTQYQAKIEAHADELRRQGHEVRTPAFDDHELDELEICEKNLTNVIWAKRIDIFWDRRSIGTIFDFGMAFALLKPVKVIYLEPKTFAGVMVKYQGSQDVFDRL
jgi:hypothetical protein